MARFTNREFNRSKRCPTNSRPNNRCPIKARIKVQLYNTGDQTIRFHSRAWF